MFDKEEFIYNNKFGKEDAEKYLQSIRCGSDDADRFLEEAGRGEPVTSNKKRRISDEVEMSEKSVNDDSSKGGKLCQWATLGEGYMAVAGTFSKLKSDVYSIEATNHGLQFLPRKVITDDLLRLPDSRSDEVLKQVENFWSLKDEFTNGNELAYGGYLHKIGLLLFGPPGSGKTCTAKFIMNGVIDLGGVVILGNGHPSTLIEGLRVFREVHPERPVVVLFEDFDALINRFGEDQYLSITDGEHTIDNCLFIATTNYPSRFDPRVFNRPGRFSDVIHIGLPTPEARETYLKHRLKEKAYDDIPYLVEQSEGFTLDHLKALVLGIYFEKKSAEAELKRLRKLFVKKKDDDGLGRSNSIGLRGE